MFFHSFLELSSYTIIGAGVRSEGVGSIDEPDSSAWLSVWGVSVCRFGFSTLPASKRSKFHTVTVLGNTYMWSSIANESEYQLIPGFVSESMWAGF